MIERWQVSAKSIDNWVKGKILLPCKGVPVIRFTIQHIAELEGIKLEKFSSLERRKLESELEDKTLLIELKDKEIAELKSRITRMVSIGVEAFKINTKKDKF